MPTKHSKHQYQIVQRDKRKVSPIRPLPQGLLGVDYSDESSSNVTILQSDPGYTPESVTLLGHLSLLATTSQTIAAGGGYIEWETEASSPAAKKLFTGLSLPSTDIPVDITGWLIMDLQGLWASYRDGGIIIIERDRAGTKVGRGYSGGPITSRLFEGTSLGIDVEVDDIIRIEVPNESGTTQTLNDAEISIAIWESA